MGFLEWLRGEDLLQSLSYGYKTISYSNGVHVAIESVKQKQKISGKFLFGSMLQVAVHHPSYQPLFHLSSLHFL